MLRPDHSRFHMGRLAEANFPFIHQQFEPRPVCQLLRPFLDAGERNRAIRNSLRSNMVKKQIHDAAIGRIYSFIF